MEADPLLIQAEQKLINQADELVVLVELEQVRETLEPDPLRAGADRHHRHRRPGGRPGGGDARGGGRSARGGRAGGAGGTGGRVARGAGRGWQEGRSGRVSRFDSFVAAQDAVWPAVRSELAAGAKRSHWMWFVFPQIAGLGGSAMAVRYAIGSLARRGVSRASGAGRAAARGDAADARSCRAGGGRDPGAGGRLKFRSSMTLFQAADPGEPLFAAALAAFYDGGRTRGRSRSSRAIRGEVAENRAGMALDVDAEPGRKGGGVGGDCGGEAATGSQRTSATSAGSGARRGSAAVRARKTSTSSCSTRPSPTSAR